MSGFITDELGESNHMTFSEQTEKWGEWDGTVLDWSDKRLKRVVRLRLLSDKGFPMWDVSYCLGLDQNDKLVHVQLPFHQLAKPNWKADLIAYAKDAKVFAKGLGMLDPEVVSSLC